jgi:hypothetical protein
MNLGEGSQGGDYALGDLMEADYAQLEEGFGMSELFFIILELRASLSVRSLWLSELIQGPV